MRKSSYIAFALTLSVGLAMPACTTGTDPDIPPGSVADSGSTTGDGGGNSCVKAPPASCGVAPQCGCAANQTCDVVDATGATHCVNAGMGHLGRACRVTTDCSVGNTCFRGACRPYCATAGSACGVAGTGSCLQVQTGSNPPVDIPNLKACLVGCQLDDPSSCGGLPTNANDPVAGCVPLNGAADCETAGRSTTQCGVQADCAPGYVCVIGRGCSAWCKVAGGTCAAMQSCQKLSSPVLIGGIEYGACQ